MTDKEHTAWWIRGERAGLGEDELLDGAEHAIYAGTPTECTPGVVSGDVQLICYVSEPADDDAERLRRARLIAAAPDRLAACEAFVGWADAKGTAEACHDKLVALNTTMRATIAKAKP